MIKLSGCIEMLYRNLPIDERIRKVSALGMPAFEFWGFGNKDLNLINRLKQEVGLEIATFVADTGGSLVDPNTRPKFIEGIKRSIEAAKQVGCKNLLILVGNEIPDVRRSIQRNSIVESLKAVAKMAEDANITLNVEPLNVLVNHKGYYLSTSAEGFQIVSEVGSPSVKLLFDIYHQQITEGNLISNITANINNIGHFHVADVPGRHEPGSGEINYANIFKAISDSSYSGFVGLELVTTKPEEEALKPTLEMVAKLN